MVRLIIIFLPVLTWKRRNVGGRLLEMSPGEDQARSGEDCVRIGRVGGGLGKDKAREGRLCVWGEGMKP